MTVKSVLQLSAAALIGAIIGAGMVLWLRPTPPVVPPPPAPVAPAPSPQLQPTYEPVSFTDLEGWMDDALIEAAPALQRSCDAKSKADPEAITRVGALTFTVADLQAACAKVLAARVDTAAFRKAIAENYQAYAVSFSGNAMGMFTGYYEAELRGSLTRTGKYQTPLYGVPQNLITVSLKDFVPPKTLEGTNVPGSVVGRVVDQRLKPYFNRTEIDNQNAIADVSNVVAWVDDPVDAHVLHIQGSGQVSLEDGTVMRVGFAGSNGLAFKGLGRILIDEGVLKANNSSMGAVRDWLKKNPARARDMMNQNARYIFFRKIEGDGPIGAEGVALTAQRSMAVDPRYIPLGLPVWLETVDPDNVPLKRLMMAQDVGAAITGAVRGDYFWGPGEPAFAKAARMKSQGRYFVLVPVSQSAAQPQNSGAKP